MKRRLATALASAALLALSVTAGSDAGAQTSQDGPERTGQKNERAVPQSCPIHPEVKARTAAKCPKCRMEARKQSAARAKGNGKVQPQPQQQEGADANE